MQWKYTLNVQIQGQNINDLIAVLNQVEVMISDGKPIRRQKTDTSERIAYSIKMVEESDPENSQ